MRLTIGLLVMLTLSACRENPEDAYERGYEDGINDVCLDVQDWNANVYNELRSERIC